MIASEEAPELEQGEPGFHYSPNASTPLKSALSLLFDPSIKRPFLAFVVDFAKWQFDVPELAQVILIGNLPVEWLVKSGMGPIPPFASVPLRGTDKLRRIGRVLTFISHR